MWVQSKPPVLQMAVRIPNMNHVYVPYRVQNRQTFGIDKAGENRGIAANRYMIEVTYRRVKKWKLIRPIVERSSFHLIDSVWHWANGFANVYHKPLLPSGKAYHRSNK